MSPLQGMRLKFHDGAADIAMLDDTYADDTILFVADKQPAEVPKQVAAITAIAVQVYGRHGLQLIFEGSLKSCSTSSAMGQKKHTGVSQLMTKATLK